MVQIDLFDLTGRLTRITQGRTAVLSLSGGYNKILVSIISLNYS